MAERERPASPSRETLRLASAAAPVVPGVLYRLLNVCGGKALDVRGGGQGDGAEVQTWTYAGHPNQHWIFQEAGGGFYTLTAGHSGRVLDVKGAGKVRGAPVLQWQNRGEAHQLWRVLDLGGGRAALAPKHAPGLRLDVSGGHAGDAGGVQLWDTNKACAQQWKLERVPATSQRLRVSADGRSLVRGDGKPFFYLGDTAWELFHRLDRAQARYYLQTRRAQGFNVVQVAVLAELDGLTVPNAYGDLPLLGKDPRRPAVTPGHDPAKAAEYDYWDHVDYIVNEAAAQGMYVTLLPTWGVWVRDRPIFDVASARAYGQFLGERYRDRPVIWAVGGDRVPEDKDRPIWRAVAEGLEQGAGGRGAALISFHPPGRRGSAEWWHREPWLDFNMWQTGHCLGVRPWEQIGSSYARTPPKPVLNAEPVYEDHPVCQDAKQHGYSRAADVRNAAYWSVFSGALGHAYGHHAVWQMYGPGRPPRNGPRSSWQDALGAPVARQMRHLRALMESRPVSGRVPDLSLVEDALSGTDRIAALRGKDHALLYSASGKPLRVRLDRVPGERLKAYWFDPQTGKSRAIGNFESRGNRTFTPPSHGRDHDWVLVLDDAARGYPVPGTP